MKQIVRSFRLISFAAQRSYFLRLRPLRRTGGGWNGGVSGLNGDNPPVKVFSERGQNGDFQGFNAGSFRYDQRQFGNLGIDAASSVWVAPGYRVRLCESEGGGAGSGKCEEWGPGSYDLRYNDRASFIRVWRTDR